MASEAEAELGGLFINAKEGEVLRTTLEEIGHPQGPILIQTHVYGFGSALFDGFVDDT